MAAGWTISATARAQRAVSRIIARPVNDGGARLVTAPRSDLPAVLVTGAAFFMIVLDTSIVNLAVPRIGTEFRASLPMLQWLVDGYALIFASLLLTAGALGDRYDARRVFMAGLAVFTIASCACGFAPGLWSLQAARVLQGIGAAMLLPNSLAALNHTVTDGRRRMAAVSAWAAAGALGVAVGPVLGGVLVDTLGWRSIFLVNVPLGIAGLWLAPRHIAAAPRAIDRRLDPAGLVLSVLTLAALTGWLIAVGRVPVASPAMLAGALFCVALAAAFLRVEATRHDPMLPLDLLMRPALGWVALVGLLHNVGAYGLIFALSVAFQRVGGLSPLAAGLLFIPMTFSLAIGTRVGARLLHRFGAFRPLIWGHGVAAIGAAVLAMLGLGHGQAALLLPLCAIGGGAGITTPCMSLAVLEATERARGGLASGVLNSARQTGGVIGVALLGALLGEPPSMDGARAAACAATLAFICASVVASLIARRHRPVPAAAPGG